MKSLKLKIQNEAYVLDDGIVKVDHFINHMLDTKLLDEIGTEIALMYQGVTKVLTVESSGIAFACSAAMHLGYVPVVFARKTQSRIMGACVYKSIVKSFTKNVESTVSVDKAYLSSEDRVLIVDDFLAYGNALNGLADIVNESGATLVGCAVVIEKGFQKGRERLNKLGISVKSLANIKEIKNGEVIFDE